MILIEHGMDIPGDEALELGKQIKERKKSQSKSSASKDIRKPIKHTFLPSKNKRPHYVQTSKGHQLSEQEQLQAIEENIAAISQLPSSSIYAQHRLKILRKVKELLQVGIKRTEEEHKELERLLASLSL